MNAPKDADQDIPGVAMARGYEDARAAIIAGLFALPEGQGKNIAGNYLMGMFQMVIETIYTTRAEGVRQVDVMYGLSTLLGDILAATAAAHGDTAPVAEQGGQGLVNGFMAVLRAWSPRDDAGRSVIDTRAVLDAVAMFAALQINSLQTLELRSRATSAFAEAVGGYCVRLSPTQQARKL